MYTKFLFVLFFSTLVLSGCRPAVENRESLLPRVVSLAPSLTEIVASVDAGDMLVGRTSACDYPPDVVGKVSVVGGFGRPSLESVIAAGPTLVIDTDLEDESVIRKLKNAGIEHERIACRSLADIPRAIRRVGKLTGRDESAEQVAIRLEEGIRIFRRESASETGKPSVYIEIWHDPIMTAGKDAYLNELIEIAGGRNIAEDVEKEYFRASPEWIIERDPDVIICAYMADKGKTADRVRKRPGWDGVSAVKKGSVFDGLPNDLFLRPGPRVLRGIEVLKKCINESANH